MNSTASSMSQQIFIFIFHVKYEMLDDIIDARCIISLLVFANGNFGSTTVSNPNPTCSWTERHAHAVSSGHQGQGARLRKDGEGESVLPAATVHDGE